MVIFAVMTLIEIQNAAFLPDAIKHFDYNLFAKMNGQWHNPYVDTFMIFIREPTVWVPLYLFLVLLITINFKARGWLWVLFFLFNVMLSDYVSSTLIKGNFFRLRPCRDPYISDTIRFIVKYCPVSSSFTSSHAANHLPQQCLYLQRLKKRLVRNGRFYFYGHLRFLMRRYM